ncbi:MAG: hypothetical protein ABJ251_06655 [Paracoccaceae bacterium]
MLQRLPLTAFLILSASHASGDAHHDVQCRGLDPSRDGDADTAFECLAHYQDRLEEIEAKVSLLVDMNSGLPVVGQDHMHDGAIHGSEQHTNDFFSSIPENLAGIPSGAVVAFDLPNRCPEGWGPFAELQGRVIIGASFGIPDNLFRSEATIDRKYRDHGGQEEVALTGHEQLPRHRHEVEVGGSSRLSFVDYSQFKQDGGTSPLVSNSGTRHPYAGTGTFRTNYVGNSVPHENMPPFIALYYCKKK